MPAQIEDFNTRSQIGLRNPRSVSYNITPSRGGGVAHWGGGRQGITSSHNRCIQIVRGWQNYHMNSHGWVDIAYTGGYCNHGIALSMRGHGVRTAANGTNIGNQNYHAYVWVGGAGERPNQLAINALEWWFLEGRNLGAGNEARPHTYFTGSTCPGPIITNHLSTIHNKVIRGSRVPIDPWEEWYMSLSNSDKTKLNKLLGLSNGQLDNLVEYAQTIGSGKLDVLDNLVTVIRDRGGNNPGRSFGNQFYIFHDKERPMLQRLNELVGVNSPGGLLQTSLQGATAGGLNAFLYLNDKHDADLVTTRRYKSNKIS